MFIEKVRVLYVICRHIQININTTRADTYYKLS